MKESQIKERIGQGWIRAIITFEVVGKPAEHVAKALGEFIDNIKKDERVIVLQEEREDPLQHEDGMFSTFSEMECLVKDLETFTWLCINFSPASIEILEPEDMEMESRDVTNWLNDMLSKVHEIGANYRTVKALNDHLTIALNELIRNAIILSLRQGAKDADALAEDTGIHIDQIQPFLKHMIEKGRITQEGKQYALGRGVTYDDSTIKAVAKKETKKGKK
jgi:hypothetical protein